MINKHKDHSTKHFTRGGQITLHNIRMWIQISNKMMWVGLILFMFVLSISIFLTTTAYERYVLGEYSWAKVLPVLDDSLKTKFEQPNGHLVEIRYVTLEKSQFVKTIVHRTITKITNCSLLAFIISIIVLFMITNWLKKKGQTQTEDTLIKGDQFASKENAKHLIIKNNQQSDLSLANLPLIKNKETGHLLFHGSPGTGKTNAIKELLDQIRKRGDRVIIYDKGCTFLEEFYEPHQDVLLSALDNRGQSWDLWRECRDAADYDSLATALIPLTNADQDPFWVNAARMIFSSAAFEMRTDKNRSVIKLLRYLLTADLDVLEKYLKGTVAETLVSRKSEKTAVSIKSVLATYLRSLKYIKEGVNPFSIREWIQNEEGNNWLFITSIGDRHDALKPLITSWLDIAVNALLSLVPNDERRIWLIIDELTSLHQLPYLTQTLSESRKFGGCVVIGIQNYAQLQKLYGANGAKEISSLLNTRFLFAQRDPDIAKWSAENFGETIVEEVHEGISYGANTMRDGISMNRVETRKPLISFSEIMSLADLYSYVRLPGNFPVTKVDFTYKKRSRAQKGFIMRMIDESKMQEIDILLEGITANGSGVVKTETEETLNGLASHKGIKSELLDL